MKIIKHCYIIGFIFLLNLSTVLHARQLYQKGDFSISLPDGWVEIPSDVIDAYEKEIARLAPNAPAQHCDYGFQLGSADNWFEYPYILVQIKNIGRIPESQIEKLEGYSVQESLDKHKSDLSTVLSNVQAGKMYYDKTSRIIWLRIEANVVDVGPISGLSGMILTEKGFIQVSGCSLKSDYSTYEPVFRATVMSVTPSSELVYKPKWSDSLPPAVSSIDWSKVAGKAIAGAIIAGLVALLSGLRRKKKE
ncbi:hypothetical protein [Desulfonauticus submarinus]